MILDEIKAATKKRVADCKKNIPLEQMKEMACGKKASQDFPFEEKLRKKGVSFICEVNTRRRGRTVCPFSRNRIILWGVRHI